LLHRALHLSSFCSTLDAAVSFVAAPAEHFAVCGGALQSCQGRGRCLCHKCQGQGLSNTWLWKPAEDGGWGPRGYWER